MVFLDSDSSPLESMTADVAKASNSSPLLMMRWSAANVVRMLRTLLFSEDEARWPDEKVAMLRMRRPGRRTTISMQAMKDATDQVLPHRRGHMISVPTLNDVSLNSSMRR